MGFGPDREPPVGARPGRMPIAASAKGWWRQAGSRAQDEQPVPSQQQRFSGARSSPEQDTAPVPEPTPDESDLAHQIAVLLATPARRLAPAPQQRPHVSIASPPEDAIAVPQPVDHLLPPPLPLPDPDWTQAEPGARGHGSALAFPVAQYAKRCSGRRQIKERRPGTVFAWMLTLIILTTVLASASIGLLGVDRLAEAAVEAVMQAEAAVAAVRSLLGL